MGRRENISEWLGGTVVLILLALGLTYLVRRHLLPSKPLKGGSDKAACVQRYADRFKETMIAFLALLEAERGGPDAARLAGVARRYPKVTVRPVVDMREIQSDMGLSYTETLAQVRAWLEAQGKSVAELASVRDAFAETLEEQARAKLKMEVDLFSGSA